MNKRSSDSQWLATYIFIGVGMIILSIWLFADFDGKETQKKFGYIFLIALNLSGFYFWRKMVDFKLDNGYAVLSRGKKTERIPISSIAKVSPWRKGNYRPVFIWLNRPTKFGKFVVFLDGYYMFKFGTNAKGDYLKAIVKIAQNKTKKGAP